MFLQYLLVGRRSLWNELRALHDSIGSNPWIISDDFNAVRRQSDRSDVHSFDVDAGYEFNLCLEDVDMEDLNSKAYMV